jgi:hypothetical protein
MRELLVMSIIGIFTIGIAAAQAKKSGSCDRTCLEDIADQLPSSGMQECEL